MVLQAVWGEGWGCCEVMAQGYNEAMAVLYWDSSESLKIRDLSKLCLLFTMGVQGALGQSVLPQGHVSPRHPGDQEGREAQG